VRRWVEDRAGWLALGAVVLVLVFMLGLLAGRNAAQTLPVKDPVYGAPLVKNGVAAVMLCGNWPDKRGLGLTEAAMGKGVWTPAPREGGCQVWYHHPPHPDEEWYREGTGGSPTSGPASWYWYWDGN
jgi:hypothetical protein